MENMVEPYVEALKFLTPLSFDVITYGLIARLADPRREKLKDDGYNIAEWSAPPPVVVSDACHNFPYSGSIYIVAVFGPEAGCTFSPRVLAKGFRK